MVTVINSYAFYFSFLILVQGFHGFVVYKSLADGKYIHCFPNESVKNYHYSLLIYKNSP